MIFIYIFCALALVVVVFLAIIAMQPADFRITRSALIPAPAPIVFANINDFHRWEGWSPWLKLDPKAKTTYQGSPSGSGAIFTWTGNKKVGEGRMTILESRPNEFVRIKLEFFKPWQATSTAEFTLQPQADQTQVTWAMIGKRRFMEKAVCLFMNMDKLVGGDFERGLNNLKTASQTAATR